jgi:hypothetical protein
MLQLWTRTPAQKQRYHSNVKGRMPVVPVHCELTESQIDRRTPAVLCAQKGLRQRQPTIEHCRVHY